MPEPEKKIWYFIRNKQINGINFRRQVSIGSYVVDFYSFERKLAIEIDGDSHFESDEAEKYDRVRSKYLKNKGIELIRFTNTDVMQNVEGCVESLLDILERTPPNLPFEGRNQADVATPPRLPSKGRNQNE